VKTRLLQARLPLAGSCAFAMTVWAVFFNTMFLVPNSFAEMDKRRVEKLFLEGRYERAVQEAQALTESRHSQKDELYYIMGLSELKLNKFADARKNFSHIIAKYPRSNRMFDSKLGIADSYLLEGNRGKAIGLYEEMLTRFPDDKDIEIVRDRLEEYKGEASAKMDRPRYAGRMSSGTVQVGVFKNRVNAERLVKKLSREGYEGYAEPSSDLSRRLYKVKVRNPASTEDLKDLAARLKADGYETKICDE